MAVAIIKRILALGLLGSLLSACATYHQPRYGADGVYFDQRHAAPAQVVIVNPMLYPYWSLDFFYASHFYRPYRSPFFLHDPWFFHDPWLYPRRGWSSRVVWSHPVVYAAPPVDQRLWLMQEARSPTRSARPASWNDPASEVQLRHRLAEDRAAARHRGTSGWSGGASTRMPTDRAGQTGAAPASRPVQTRPVAPSRQPAPVPRAQPQQRTREARSQAPARENRAPAATTRTSANRERQVER